MSDHALLHNRGVIRRRVWALPVLFLCIFTVLFIILAVVHIDVSRNPTYLHIVAWTLAGLVLWPLLRTHPVSPRSAAALEWGQELLSRRRSGLRVNASLTLIAALAHSFATNPYAEELLTLVVIAALATCLMVMRSPRGDGAIVEDEFVKAMCARAVSLGFIVMFASMVVLSCLAVFRPEWLSRGVALALAIPVAAMGWRFVLLTQSSGRDG